MKKAIIMMIVVFALVVWPFSGVWQLLSGIIGGGVRESFIYPIYGGIILLSGIIVVCTELILEEIKSLKDDIKDKKKDADNFKFGELRKSGFWKGGYCYAEKVELFFKHRYWFIHRSFHWVRNL